MTRRIKLIIGIVLLLICTPLQAAKPDNPFSWDLSYQKIFAKSQVAKNDTMRIFFRETARARKGKLVRAGLPASLLKEMKKQNIKTAILVDYQAFWFSGKRMVSLYIETADRIYVDLYETKARKKVRRRILERKRWIVLDRFFAKLKQETPTFEHDLSAPKGYTFSGYIGAVSQYRKGKISQMLLTPEDMLRFDMSAGRVMRVMNKVMGLP